VKSTSLAISLLALWIILQGFAHLSLNLGRWKCYDAFESNRNQLLQSHVLTIEVRNSDSFSWEKAGKEFYLNGKLYDVLSAKSTDGGWSYNCVLDNKENELLASYNKIKDSRKQTESATNDILKRNVIKYFIPDEQPDWPVEYPMPTYANWKTDRPEFVSLAVFSPPPECIDLR
jgi:hypothetical protein